MNPYDKPVDWLGGELKTPPKSMEARLIDLKLALRASIKEERAKQDVTQAELAKAIGSSQSRIAKIERGDPSVSVDLLLKALMVLGMTNRQISKIFA